MRMRMKRSGKIWFKWFQLLCSVSECFYTEKAMQVDFFSLSQVSRDMPTPLLLLLPMPSTQIHSSSSSSPLHFCDSIDFIVQRIWVNFALFLSHFLFLFILRPAGESSRSIRGAINETAETRNNLQCIQSEANSSSPSLSLFFHSWLMHPSVYLASVSTVIWVRTGETTSSTRESERESACEKRKHESLSVW